MFRGRCLAVSPNFEIAKNNMAIALTDLGTKVTLSKFRIMLILFQKHNSYYKFDVLFLFQSKGKILKLSPCLL